MEQMKLIDGTNEADWQFANTTDIQGDCKANITPLKIAKRLRLFALFYEILHDNSLQCQNCYLEKQHHGKIMQKLCIIYVSDAG